MGQGLVIVHREPCKSIIQGLLVVCKIFFLINAGYGRRISLRLASDRMRPWVEGEKGPAAWYRTKQAEEI